MSNLTPWHLFLDKYRKKSGLCKEKLAKIQDFPRNEKVVVPKGATHGNDLESLQNARGRVRKFIFFLSQFVKDDSSIFSSIITPSSKPLLSDWLGLFSGEITMIYTIR